ncbi:Peroxisome chaperone and import receptor [Oleoguttula sp. CCFEE 5521]
MQASSSAAEAATAGAGTEEDLLAQMMKELGGAGAGGAGEEDFNGMLMSMMAQLTHKEILYEPMKELSDKFPAWMEKNGEGKVGKEDMARYREQQVLVGEIVGRFERKGYSDEDEGDREYIVERMQKMQAAGSPPPDLVGDMSAAQEALGELEGGCPTQ